MARNGSGIYNAPAGNPVQVGTTIQASWANTLVSDLGGEITNSLPRDGQAPMTGTLRVVDGSLVGPAVAFNSESGTGIYRPGTSQIALVTSGTNALTANAGKIGIGTTTPASALNIAGVDPYIRIDSSNYYGGINFYSSVSGNNNTAQIRQYDGTGLMIYGAPTISFLTNSGNTLNASTERLRITASGDIGIGTTPAVRLHARTDGAGVGTIARFERVNAADTYSLNINVDPDADVVELRAGGTTNGSLTFATNNTERLRIDAAGNLGVGVTPSAWRSGYKAIETNFGSFSSADNATTRLSLNAYQSSTGWLTRNLGNSLMFELVNGGGFQWQMAPSVAAGAAPTFTQAMTLDANGNLGVGASSPQGSLNIERSSASGTATTIPAIVLSNRNSTSGTFVAGGVFSNTHRDISTSSYTAGVWFEKQNDSTSGAASSQGAVVFGTSGSNSGGALPIERMRIDAPGNVGIGVVPSAWGSPFSSVLEFPNGNSLSQSVTAGVFQMGANNYYNGTNYIYKATGTATRYRQDTGQHQWSTAASGAAGATVAFTQAMTLDASGNLGIGTSTPVSNRQLTLYSAASTAGISLRTGVSGLATTDGADLSLSITNDLYLTNRENGGVILETNATERLRISATGNVGVGTASPAAKLDVNGAIVQNITAVAAADIDVSTGNYFTKTITGATTFTFSGGIASRFTSFMLKLTNGGSFGVTWPASVKWPSGIVPTLTVTGIDIINFVSDDGGTTWLGVLAAKDVR